MSEQPTPLDLPSIKEWQSEFMDAVVVYANEQERRPPWWRRWLTPFVVLLVLAGGGLATARIIDYIGTDPEMPPFQGEAHGFVNLETGEAIHCPDGSRLIRVPTSTEFDPTFYPRLPRCPDGSVPAIYREQLKALEDFQQNAPAGSVTDDPRFEFEIPDDGSEEIPPPDEFLTPGGGH